MNGMCDAENNHRHYRIERKFGAGSGWRDCIENVPFLFSYLQNVLCYKKKSLIEILSYKFSFLMLSFTDNEPPTFSKCPKDIVREEKVSLIRVNWKHPVFSDNSGVLPSVSSSFQSGATFRVPGNYKNTYAAKDQSDNENKNCTFRIILKSELYNEVGRLLVVMEVRRKPESRVPMHRSCLRDRKKFHPIPISHHILRS